MTNIKTTKYDLSYDDDYVILIDKTSDELIIRLFNDEINTLNIQGEKTALNLNVKSFSLLSEKEIKLKSKMSETTPKIPSIFLN